MTPSTTPLTFHRGAKWDQVITFYQSGTETPVNLTGLGPFVMEIRRKKGGPLLLSFTYTATDLTNGQIQFTATATQTETLPQPANFDRPLVAYYGIRDAQNNLYANGPAHIYDAIPDPA
jgi:hypothetical protein